MLSHAVQNRGTGTDSRRFLCRGLRRGVSFVEFIGCLTAMAGGVVLGSIYLGVDVETMAVKMLEKADMEVPEFLAVEVPVEDRAAEDRATEDGVGPDETAAAETRGASSSASLGSDEIAAADLKLAVEAATPVALPQAEKQAATQACWFALEQCVQAEAAHRTQSVTSPGSWQLFDYLLIRKNGHVTAVETLEQLKLAGVDQRLCVHVDTVLTWQRAGADLYSRATQLLTDAPAGKLSGPFAQSWQSAATQHRMEENLVLKKHAAVKSYLEHASKATVSGE